MWKNTCWWRKEKQKTFQLLYFPRKRKYSTEAWSKLWGYWQMSKMIHVGLITLRSWEKVLTVKYIYVLSYLWNCPVVLVGVLLVNQRPVPFAENHERIHRPPNAVRPPYWSLCRRYRCNRRQCRGRGRGRGGQALVVEDVLVGKIPARRFWNIRFLKRKITLVNV